MNSKEDKLQYTCPECGEQSITLEFVSIEDEIFVFDKTCDKCGDISEEHYRAVYLRTVKSDK